MQRDGENLLLMVSEHTDNEKRYYLDNTSINIDTIKSLATEQNDALWNPSEIKEKEEQIKRIKEKTASHEEVKLNEQLTEGDMNTSCKKEQRNTGACVVSSFMQSSLASFSKLPNSEVAYYMSSASPESTEAFNEDDEVREESFVNSLNQLAIHMQSSMRLTLSKKRKECISIWMARAYPNIVIEALTEIFDVNAERKWDECLQKANSCLQLIEKFPEEVLPDKDELFMNIYSYFCPMFVETGDFSKAIVYPDVNWIRDEELMCAMEKLLKRLSEDKCPYETAMLYFEISIRHMTLLKSPERIKYFKDRSLYAIRKSKDAELQLYCIALFALVEWKTSAAYFGPAGKREYFRRLSFSMERSVQFAKDMKDELGNVIRTLLQVAEIRCKRPYSQEIDSWSKTRNTIGVRLPWTQTTSGPYGLSSHQSKLAGAIQREDDIYVQQYLENQNWKDQDLILCLNYSLELFEHKGNQVLVKTFLPWICNECVKVHQPYKVYVWAASISKENDVHGIPVLVCNYREVVDKKFKDNFFFGLPVVYREYNTVNEEDISVQSSEIFSESFLTPNEAIQANEIISVNTESLMRNHSNLEAIKPCPVRSECLVVKKETCIVLYCRMKGFVPFGEKPFPKILSTSEKSITVDVREGFYIPAMFQKNADVINAERPWDRHLFRMGFSMGPNNKEISATVGPFVKLDGNNVGFLTCAHVFGVPCNIKTALETGVVHPAIGTRAPDVNVDGDPICGYVDKIVLDIDPSSCVNIDAALVRLIPEKVPQIGRFTWMDDSSRKAAGLTAEESLTFDHGEIIVKEQVDEILSGNGKIIKFGAASGVTSSNMFDPGRAVIRIGEAELLHNQSQEFLPIIGGTRSYVLKGQYLVRSSPIRAFLIPGDSGAGVFYIDKHKRIRCIGIATGYFSNTFEAVVTPIEDVLSALNLDNSGLMRFNV